VQAPVGVEAEELADDLDRQHLSLSARTGAGPRWRSRHSRHRSRTRSSTTQNTTMMRVSRSMAAAHEAALPQTNRRRASESYATSTARKNLHIGLALQLHYLLQV
jgi:hypothetical protein